MRAGVVKIANDIRKIIESAFRHGIDGRSSGSDFSVLQDVGIVFQRNGGRYRVFRIKFRVEVFQGLCGEWLVIQCGRVSLPLVGGDGCLVHIRIGGDQLWGNA